MDFKALINSKLSLIQERNYYYNIPENKELLMYDFYTMTYIDSLIKSGKATPGGLTDNFGRKEKTATNVMGIKQSTLDSFETIKTQIIDHLKPELLNCVFFSLMCEFRHVVRDHSMDVISAVFPDKQDQEIVQRFAYEYENLGGEGAKKHKNMSISAANVLATARKDKHDKRMAQHTAKMGGENDQKYMNAYAAGKKTVKKLGIDERELVRVATHAMNRFANRSRTNNIKGLEGQDFKLEDNMEWWEVLDKYVTLYKEYLTRKEDLETGKAQAEWEVNKPIRAKHARSMFLRYGIIIKPEPEPKDLPPPEPPTPPTQVTKEVLEEYMQKRLLYDAEHDKYEKELAKYKKELEDYESGKDITLNLASGAPLAHKPNPPAKPELEFPDKPKWTEFGKQIPWGSSYGGRGWWEIGVAWTKLNRAHTELENILYIDNIYHQQHNNGTVFTKIKQYNKGGYEWITNALNFKADAKENWERIKKTMSLTENRRRQIDSMFIEILKGTGDKSWNQYMHPEKDIKVPDKKIASRDWEALKNEKLDSLSDGYVYIGKGVSNTDKPFKGFTAIPELKTLDTKDIYMISHVSTDQKIYSGNNVGNDEVSDYYIKETKWNELFGKLDKNEIPTSHSEWIKVLATNSLEKNKETLINVLQQLLNSNESDAEPTDYATHSYVDGFLGWARDYINGVPSAISPTHIYSKIIDLFSDITKITDTSFAYNLLQAAAAINESEYVNNVKSFMGKALHILINQKKMSSKNEKKLLKVVGFEKQSKEDTKEDTTKEEPEIPIIKTADSPFEERDWVLLKTEGKKQFPLLGEDWVYVGKGLPDKSLHSHFSAKDVAISKKDLAFVYPGSPADKGANGDAIYYHYALKKDKWDQIFGHLEAKVDETSWTPDQPIDFNNMDWLARKKYGETKYPNIKKMEWVYIGYGFRPNHPQTPNAPANGFAPFLYEIDNSITHVDIGKLVRTNTGTLTHIEPNMLGNAPTFQYALAKDKWDKLFGHLEKASPAATNNSWIFTIRDWVALKKEGEKKFPHLVKGIYVGRGFLKTFKEDPSKQEISLKHMFQRFDENIKVSDIGIVYSADSTGEFGYSGTLEDSDYVLKSEVWNKIFGHLVGTESKDAEPLVAHQAAYNIKDWVGLKKEGDEKYPFIKAQNAVYVGLGDYLTYKGDHNTTLLKVFRDIDPSVQSDDMGIARLYNGTISYGYAGHLKGEHYVLKKDVWDKLFGHLEKGEKSKNSVPDIKLWACKFKDWVALKKEGETKYPASKDRAIYLGHGDMFDTIHGQYSLLGILQRVHPQVKKDDLGILSKNNNKDKVDFTYGYNGSLTDEEYFLKPNVWNQLFGHLENTQTSDKKPNPYHHLGETWHNLASQKQAPEQPEKWVYIGKGADTNHLDKQLNIIGDNDYQLAEFTINGKFTTNYSTGNPYHGTVELSDYFLSKPKWESLFGKLTDEKIKTDDTSAANKLSGPIDSKNHQGETWQSIAKIKKSPTDPEKWVYIGNGSKEISLIAQLHLEKDATAKLAEYTKTGYFHIGQFISDYHTIKGIIPTSDYYLNKEKWDELFGDSKNPKTGDGKSQKFSDDELKKANYLLASKNGKHYLINNTKQGDIRILSDQIRVRSRSFSTKDDSQELLNYLKTFDIEQIYNSPSLIQKRVITDSFPKLTGKFLEFQSPWSDNMQVYYMHNISDIVANNYFKLYVLVKLPSDKSYEMHYYNYSTVSMSGLIDILFIPSLKVLTDEDEIKSLKKVITDANLPLNPRSFKDYVKEKEKEKDGEIPRFMVLKTTDDRMYINWVPDPDNYKDKPENTIIKYKALYFDYNRELIVEKYSCSIQSYKHMINGTGGTSLTNTSTGSEIEELEIPNTFLNYLNDKKFASTTKNNYCTKDGIVYILKDDGGDDVAVAGFTLKTLISPILRRWFTISKISKEENEKINNYIKSNLNSENSDEEKEEKEKTNKLDRYYVIDFDSVKWLLLQLPEKTNYIHEYLDIPYNCLTFYPFHPNKFFLNTPFSTVSNIKKFISKHNILSSSNSFNDIKIPQPFIDALDNTIFTYHGTIRAFYSSKYDKRYDFKMDEKANYIILQSYNKYQMITLGGAAHSMFYDCMEGFKDSASISGYKLEMLLAAIDEWENKI